MCQKFFFMKLPVSSNTFFPPFSSAWQRSFLVCRLFRDVTVCVHCQRFCIFPHPSLLITSHLWTFRTAVAIVKVLPWLWNEHWEIFGKEQSNSIMLWWFFSKMILSRSKEHFLFYPHLPAITILLSSNIYGSRQPHQNIKTRNVFMILYFKVYNRMIKIP